MLMQDHKDLITEDVNVVLMLMRRYYYLLKMLTRCQCDEKTMNKNI